MMRARKQQASLNILYRVFLVIRSYPLGEILRHLGKGPPDPLLNVNQQPLQFQTLAQPDCRRWRSVQHALLNLNRLAFRVATGVEDPLGRLREQDAWRFFLLHHPEFVTRDILERLRAATALLEAHFPRRVLPPTYTHDGRFAEVHEYCRGQLRPMMDAWGG